MTCRGAAAAAIVSGLAFGGLALTVTNATPVPLSEVASEIGCTKVTELDEFARMGGAAVDARCDLPDGQTVRVVQVVDARAFRGFLTAHPHLVVGYPDLTWFVVGTRSAINAAKLADENGEG